MRHSRMGLPGSQRLSKVGKKPGNNALGDGKSSARYKGAGHGNGDMRSINRNAGPLKNGPIYGGVTDAREEELTQVTYAPFYVYIALAAMALGVGWGVGRFERYRKDNALALKFSTALTKQVKNWEAKHGDDWSNVLYGRPNLSVTGLEEDVRVRSSGHVYDVISVQDGRDLSSTKMFYPRGTIKCARRHFSDFNLRSLEGIKGPDESPITALIFGKDYASGVAKDGEGFFLNLRRDDPAVSAGP